MKRIMVHHPAGTLNPKGGPVRDGRKPAAARPTASGNPLIYNRIYNQRKVPGLSLADAS